ncbi:hypothetical protein Tco_0311869 [Tanacetum coccineum]
MSDDVEPMFIQAHDPDYVPEPIYPEYIPLEDDHEFLAEEQPLPPVDSPTAESPGNMFMSGSRRGSRGVEDDGQRMRMRRTRKVGGALSCRLTLLPFITVDESVFPPEGTALCAWPTPCTSSPLLPSSGFQPNFQTLRISILQALIDAVTAALPSPPLPPLPPSLYIPPPVDRRDDILESEQPPCKRLYLSTLGSRYEVGESFTARPTKDLAEGSVPEIAFMTVGEVNTRVTELAELHERDTQDLYALLEDAQDRDSMDGGGGGPMLPERHWASLDRIESGDSSGASDPS